MDFVIFELAKKLKEKGYPQVKQDTLAMYSEYGDWFSLVSTIDEEYSFGDFDEHDYICPTISQVLKWLREEKKLHVRASVYFIGWCVDVTNMNGKRIYSTECEYYNYEQAVLVGIEYILDNLI